MMSTKNSLEPILEISILPDSRVSEKSKNLFEKQQKEQFIQKVSLIIIL